MAEHPAAMPHGPIREIFPDVYTVRGSVRFAPGIRITRNMVVLRHAGELTVISAVRLRGEVEAELDALGRVRHVVKLGAFHGMDDGYYVERYQAHYWTLPGVKAGLGATRTLGEDPFPVPLVDVLPFASAQPEAVLHCRFVEGGLVVAVDAIQHWTNTDGCSALAKIVTRVMGFMKPVNIGPPWRKGMTPRGGSLEADFRALVALGFEHVIGGHGDLRRGDGAAGLKATVDRLYGG